MVNAANYPGVGTAAAGAQTIMVGTRVPGGSPQIAAGNMLLVIQMQDAAIDATNTDAYGDGVAGGTASGATAINQSGIDEFVVATGPVAGGAVPVSGTSAGNGLINGYATAAATPTRGRRTFQVIRVPQYTTA